MTIPAVKARTKTVTRRRADTWTTLKVGQVLTLIEKGMGLKTGQKQITLAHVRITSITVEPLLNIFDEENATAKEGLPEMSPSEFVRFWLHGHHHKITDRSAQCRRIEWAYLEGNNQ